MVVGVEVAVVVAEVGSVAVGVLVGVVVRDAVAVVVPDVVDGVVVGDVVGVVTVQPRNPPDANASVAALSAAASRTHSLRAAGMWNSLPSLHSSGGRRSEPGPRNACAAACSDAAVAAHFAEAVDTTNARASPP